MLYEFLRALRKVLRLRFAPGLLLCNCDRFTYQRPLLRCREIRYVEYSEVVVSVMGCHRLPSPANSALHAPGAGSGQR